MDQNNYLQTIYNACYLKYIQTIFGTRVPHSTDDISEMLSGIDSNLYAICLVSHSVPKELIKLMGPIILRTHRKLAEQDPTSADQMHENGLVRCGNGSFAQFWCGFIYFDDAICISTTPQMQCNFNVLKKVV